jgi:hypothetical protein
MSCPNCPPVKSEEESKQLDEQISAEAENKKMNSATKWFLIITGILCIMLFFIIFFGIKWVYNEETAIPSMEYNGFEFKKMSGLWHTTWMKDGQPYTVTLRYNPEEVETVPMLGEISTNFSKQQIYLSFDPTANSSEFKYIALANAELSLSLVKAFGKEPIAACIKNETEACKDRPIVTCESKDKAVILVSANGDPAILMKNNCVILKGEGLDILKSVDKLLYTRYGIILPITQSFDISLLRGAPEPQN